jgi:hypothetical protein
MKSRIVALFSLIIGLSVFSVALAWSGPSQTPTGGNVAAPINVGTTAQSKDGYLGVNESTAPIFPFEDDGSAWINGSIVINLANQYINFNAGSAGSGSSGYGFRDNAGILQFRNGGDPTGTWYNVSSSTAWTTVTGGNIYYNGGNVGIGTATPAAPLDVSIPGAGGDIELLAGNENNPTLRSTSPTNNVTISSALDIEFFAYGTDLPGDPLPDISIDTNPWEPHAVHINDPLDVTTTITAGGNVYANSFQSNSDERLKKDIRPLTGNLAAVLQLQPVTYYWKNPTSGAGLQIGFIAQQVQSVVPEIVDTDASTTLESIDYSHITPLLVGSVQELNQKVEDQQQEIDQLEKEVQELENKQ